MGLLTFSAWQENKPALSTQEQPDYSLISLGKQNELACISPAKIRPEQCEKALLVRDEDTLSLWSAEYPSVTQAYLSADEFQKIGRKAFVIGKSVILVDSSSTLFWDLEASQMIHRAMDPKGKLDEKSQRPFPQLAQIPGSESVHRDSHLDQRSAQAWLCRSYALKAGQMEVCMAEFENQGQCLAWLKAFGKATYALGDSTKGIWNSADQNEKAFLSCQEGQGLSLHGTVDQLYLKSWGEQCLERQRLFKDWNR